MARSDKPTAAADHAQRRFDVFSARLAAQKFERGPGRVANERAQRGCSSRRSLGHDSRTLWTGANVISQGRYVAFQMAEVAIPRNLFADIPRLIAELRSSIA
jgi:hypothetical protein